MHWQHCFWGSFESISLAELGDQRTHVGLLGDREDRRLAGMTRPVHNHKVLVELVRRNSSRDLPVHVLSKLAKTARVVGAHCIKLDFRAGLECAGHISGKVSHLDESIDMQIEYHITFEHWSNVPRSR